MEHYIIYNTHKDKFVLSSKDIRGNFINYQLVDTAEEATVFTYPESGFNNFKDSHDVIDAVNFLKWYSDNFSSYIFCSCITKYTNPLRLLTILHIDYLNPVLNCEHIDDRIGETIIFK